MKEHNLFISWSGDLSREIAQEIQEGLKMILQELNPFLSSTDIDKGTFWITNLQDAFESIKTGILIITPENKTNPWLLFEAGAIAKGIGKNKVIPLLFNLEIEDLGAPLNLLQCAKFNKADFLELVKSVNKELRNPLDERRMTDTYNAFFNKIDGRIKEAEAKHAKQEESVTVIEADKMLFEMYSKQSEILKYLSQLRSTDTYNDIVDIKSKLNSLQITPNGTNIDTVLQNPGRLNSRKELECKVYRFKTAKEPWIGFIGFDNDGKAMEVFAFEVVESAFPIPVKITNGKILCVRNEDGTYRYDFQYIDKYGYKVTMGGLSHQGIVSSIHYGHVINLLLQSRISREALGALLNYLKISKPSLINWCNAVQTIIKRFDQKKSSEG